MQEIGLMNLVPRSHMGKFFTPFGSHKAAIITVKNLWVSDVLEK
jgi:hypothetical protein